MAENNGGSGGALIFAVGTLFGAFLVYLVMKSREQPVQTASMAPPPVPQYIQPPQPLVMQPIIIPSFAPAQPQILSIPPPQIAPSPPPQIIAAPKAEPKAVQAIENEEEWIVKKDKRGRLEGITVHRKVMPVE